MHIRCIARPHPLRFAAWYRKSRNFWISLRQFSPSNAQRNLTWTYTFLRSIREISHDVHHYWSQFRQNGTVNDNPETMQTIRQAETPLRQSTAKIGGSVSVRGCRHHTGACRRRAAFGEYFTIRRSVNDLDSIYTNSRWYSNTLFVNVIHIFDHNILWCLSK